MSITPLRAIIWLSTIAAVAVTGYAQLFDELNVGIFGALIANGVAGLAFGVSQYGSRDTDEENAASDASMKTLGWSLVAQFVSAVVFAAIAFFALRPEGGVWLVGLLYFGLAVALMMGAAFATYIVVNPVIGLVHSLVRMSQGKPVNSAAALWAALLLSFAGFAVAMTVGIDVTNASGYLGPDGEATARLIVLFTGAQDATVVVTSPGMVWVARGLLLIFALVIVHMVRKKVSSDPTSGATPQ
jgi:hypothetical protein